MTSVAVRIPNFLHRDETPLVFGEIDNIVVTAPKVMARDDKDVFAKDIPFLCDDFCREPWI